MLLKHPYLWVGLPTNDCTECLPLSKMQIQMWPLPPQLFVLSRKAIKLRKEVSNFSLYAHWYRTIFQLPCAKLKNPQTHKLVELLESSLHTLFYMFIYMFKCILCLYVWEYILLGFLQACLGRWWSELQKTGEGNLMPPVILCPEKLKGVLVYECITPSKSSRRWGNIIKNDSEGR